MFPRRLALFAFLLLAAGTGCKIQQAETPAPVPTAIQFIVPPDPWPYPFSQAVRAGDFLFVSGQIGSVTNDGVVTLVPGGIEAETHQTMKNIKAILENNGSSLERVVKCIVMIEEMSEWPRMNVIYAEYFPGPKPARSALGADGLALNARVEVECTAFVG